MANLNLKNLIKESITDYLNELNTQNEEVQEEVTLEEGASEFEDKVTKDGNIYLVLKPTKDMSEGGIVKEVSLKSLIGEGYVGAYLVNTQALTAGKKALKARDAKLKENVEVGKSKVTELEAKIEDLKQSIENNSTMAIHDSLRRDELNETNNTLFTQLEKIENAVEKLKMALEKESPKKAKKEKEENSRLIKEETSMPEGVEDFFLTISNNQKPKVQKYDWHDYLIKISRSIKDKLEKNFSDDFEGHQEFLSALNKSEEYNQFKDLYNDVDDFMNKTQAGKEIKLSNGAILFLVRRQDQYGGEEMTPEKFIIRK